MKTREEETTVTPAKLFRFPLGTIKKIVKLDEDVHMVNAEAIFLISKVSIVLIYYHPYSKAIGCR